MTVARMHDMPATGPVVQRRLFTVTVGSMLVALVGLLWLMEPRAYPFGPGDDFGDSSLLGAVGSGDAGRTGIAVGLSGVLIAGGLAYLRGRAVRVLLAGAVLQAIVLGLLLPDIQVLILGAYLLAFVLPPTLLGAKVVAWLRSPRARWPVLFAGSGVVALGVAAGVLRAGTFAELAGAVGDGFAQVGVRPLYLVLALVVAAAWVGAITAHVRADGPGRMVIGIRAWIARWGVVATWVAALSPLPYVLSRLTWLTPWPLLAGGVDLEDRPEIRLMGILLGLVAEACLWLTLGLIRPRGEVFPTWIPYIGGRTVPVLVAVIPGLAGALLLTVAGRSMIQQCLVLQGEAWILAVMPLWLWGPALGVATLAYWQRRRVAGGTGRPAFALSGGEC